MLGYTEPNPILSLLSLQHHIPHHTYAKAAYRLLVRHTALYFYSTINSFFRQAPCQAYTTCLQTFKHTFQNHRSRDLTVSSFRNHQ